MGALGNPDGVDPSIRRTRKTQRDGHNSGVKIWSLCSVSSSFSHATLEQPVRTLAIKWEVYIFVKKSSCVLLHASFLPTSLFLRQYVSSIYMYISAWISKCEYNNCWTVTLVFGYMKLESTFAEHPTFAGCQIGPPILVIKGAPADHDIHVDLDWNLSFFMQQLTLFSFKIRFKKILLLQINFTALQQIIHW